MKTIISLLFLLIMITISGCNLFDEGSSDFDAKIKFSNELENFVWGDVIEISLDFDEDDDYDEIESVNFFVNGSLMTVDMVPPFDYQWAADLYDYAEYTIIAKIQTSEREESTIRRDVTLIPCMVNEDDLENFHNITETDIQGEITGNIDDNDWHGDLYTIFGPAYPNPSNEIVFIPFSVTSIDNLSLFIVNNDLELVQVLVDDQTFPVGNHIMNWLIDEQPDGLYRVIFHLSEDNHWYGDVLIDRSNN